MEAYIAQNVHWDLSALFCSREDPKIQQTWDHLFTQAKEFTEKYKGKINHPDLKANTLLEAMKAYEDIGNNLSKPCAYAGACFAVDTADPQIGQFYQKQQELASQITVQQLFFSLEIQAMPESQIETLLSDPILANYKHPIKVIRLYSSHRLTEPEEIIVEELSNTGRRAWKRFFEELLSSLSFEWKKTGEAESKTCTIELLLSELRNSDRAIRQSAADTLTEGLQKSERQIVSIYNNLIQEKKVLDRLRKYKTPESSRHLSNELEEGIVETVMEVCDETQGLVSQFYKVKKEVLGLSELTHIDRYAPIKSTTTKLNFNEAKDLVLDSFKKFHPVLEAHASQFFSQNWIDATPAPTKRGGAFCMYNTPDTHPVVFMSYMGSLSDVKTLAHELGHGVHSSLSRKQTLFNFHGTLPLAELASTLGEMIVFDRLVQSASLEDKIALYAQKIEDIFATVYRQSAMYRFEQACHHKCLNEGELTPVTLRELWQSQMQRMFGDSVTLGEQHQYWWLYVNHFFASPFYVYAYSFGELLALSIYYKTKELGEPFIEKYIYVLEMGGSKSPKELMQILDIDISSKDFWIGGTKLIEEMVNHFEELWSLHSNKQKNLMS